jgi:hypothetical protein
MSGLPLSEVIHIFEQRVNFHLYDWSAIGPHLPHRNEHEGENMIYLRKANDRGHANHGWLDPGIPFRLPTITMQTLWVFLHCA